MAEIPKSIGKYEIQSLIASGGMGNVYKAQHPTLKQELVIKRLTMQDSGHVQERFRREAQIMFNFKSDYIVDVYDHFEDGKAFHIVQEYIEGISLEDLIDRERYLPEHIALRIFLYAARALSYAHSRKVIHRDIKPGNILVSKRGEVKLLDFGIAAIRDQINDQDLTQVGMTLGTPSYMAPEQFTSSRDVDKRADIYSLGVMLYEMLTGKKPFPGTKLPETYQRIIKGKYTSPRKHNPNISPFALKIMRKCMQPKLKRRCQDLNILIRKIEKELRIRPQVGVPFESASLLADFVAGKRTTSPAHAFPWKKAAAAAILFTLASAGIIYLYSIQYHYRILHPHRYGGIRISIDSELDQQEFLELPRQVYLTAADNQDIFYELPLHQPWQNAPIFQRLPESIRPEAQSARLVSSPMYLPARAYELHVKIGTHRYQQSLFLQPETGRFTPYYYVDLNHFSFQHQAPAPLPLRVHARVRDLASRQDITAVSRIEVLHEDRFRGLDDLMAENELVTGKEHHFRISRPNYYSQELRISTDSRQADLYLEAALMPRPGFIHITSERDRTSIRLNDRRTYTSGGATPRNMELPVLQENSPELLQLPPGRYTLQAQAGRIQSNELSVRIESDSRVYFAISYDQDKNELILYAITEGEIP